MDLGRTTLGIGAVLLCLGTILTGVDMQKQVNKYNKEDPDQKTDFKTFDECNTEGKLHNKKEFIKLISQIAKDFFFGYFFSV